MRFGVNTFIWSERFTQEEIPLLSAIRKGGFDGVELPLFSPDDYQDGAVKKALKAEGLACTLCGVLPPGTSMIDEDNGVRAKTVEYMRRLIDAAVELGAGILCGPLYSPVGYLPGRRRTDEEWAHGIESYHELEDVLKAGRVKVAIEPLNRYETFFLNTAADGAAFCRAIANPNVGLLIDTYHANIEEKELTDAVQVAAPHLIHVHACENDRGVPGTGHVDWDGLVGALWAAHYDGWLTIESFGFSAGKLSAAASIWRDLAPSASDIAFEGVQFLRQRFGAD